MNKIITILILFCMLLSITAFVSATGTIESFTLVDSKTNRDISKYANLRSDTTINLDDLPANINIRANYNGDVDSVEFRVDGKRTRVENVDPYALAGDLYSNYYDWKPLQKTYEITATPYDKNTAKGSAGGAKTIELDFKRNSGNVENAASGTSGSSDIQKFFLVNTKSNSIIRQVSNDDVIDLDEVGDYVSVVAQATNEVESVKFYLDGRDFRTENVEPYALAGDLYSNYYDWKPGMKSYTIMAVPYMANGAKGNPGASKSISLRFTKDGNAAPGNTNNDAGSASNNDNTNNNNNNVNTNPDTLPITGSDPNDYGVVVPESEITIGNGNAGVITSEFKKWHTVEIVFTGPSSSETASTNPFADYRLDVTFLGPDNKKYVVPGHYAADANAANSGATSGSKWRVLFTPDQVGNWYYVASFRKGKNVAVELNTNAGTPTSFDGASGQFQVDATNKNAPDFRSKGRLNYVGEHYLQFEETGEYFIKAGSDAPENLLAFADFDNTPNTGSRRKTYSSHVQDYKSGDPSWKGGKGKGLIGAVNYMSSKKMNAMSFLTMNINGDDKNVFPYVTYNGNKAPQNDRLRFDVSKLDQWEIVFDHMQKKGIFLHFKTQETENDNLLDGGKVGIERKLYYRELVSRFGHHLALNWNFGEENTQNIDDVKDMAEYMKAIDPYQHLRVIHTYPNQQNKYDLLLGSKSAYTGTSLQNDYAATYDRTYEWVDKSAKANKKWVVSNDEQGDYRCGVPPDGHKAGDGDANCDYTQEDIREETLWGNLMAGGAGVEYYFGYRLAESDLTLQNFRSRDKAWSDASHALSFFNKLPLTEMSACEELIDSGAYCFGKAGDIYALYTESGNIQVDIPSHEYTLQWYNPETGELGSNISISGGDNLNLRTAPFSGDAAALLVRNGYSYQGYGINAGVSTTTTSGTSTNTGSNTNTNSGSSTSSGSGTVSQGSSDVIVVEAENFASQTNNNQRKWYPANSGVTPDPDPSHASSASGGQYLELLPDTRVTHNDPLVDGVSFSNSGGLNVLNYKVNFEKTGRYYVWVRAYSTGSEDNGIHVGLDGTWPSTGARMQWCAGKNTWRWESKQRTNAVHCGEPGKIYLDINSPGEHTISFSMREDGFEFDKFLLTQDANFARPSGAGPSQSTTN